MIPPLALYDELLQFRYEEVVVLLAKVVGASRWRSSQPTCTIEVRSSKWDAMRTAGKHKSAQCTQAVVWDSPWPLVRLRIWKDSRSGECCCDGADGRETRG